MSDVIVIGGIAALALSASVCFALAAGGDLELVDLVVILVACCVSVFLTVWAQ